MGLIEKFSKICILIITEGRDQANDCDSTVCAVLLRSLFLVMF